MQPYLTGNHHSDLYYHIHFLNCIWGFGVHVKNMQDSCIGTHMAVCLLPSSPSPTSGISPHAIPPQFSPCCPSPIPPNRPQCVVLPSLCPCILIVHHPPMSENMRYFMFCSCVSLLRMMFSRFIYFPTKDTNSSFFDCCIFHCVYVPHFPSPVYHWWAFGLVPGLCYCKQCCNEHSCTCVLIVEQFIVLWLYTQ